MRAVLGRVALDQLGFAPAFLPAFWLGLQLLDGDLDVSHVRPRSCVRASEGVSCGVRQVYAWVMSVG
jgi:hypothetical protein